MLKRKLNYSNTYTVKKENLIFSNKNLWSSNGVLQIPVSMNCNSSFLVYSENNGGLPNAANSYAVKISPSEFILFDVGPGAYKYILQNLNYVSEETPIIKTVFLTHWHCDHFGGIDELPKDVQIYASENIINSFNIQDKFTTAGYLYDKEYKKPNKNVINLSTGEKTYNSLCTVKSFSTPGHTPYCTSYIVTINNHTIMIVGDLIWGGFQEVIDSNDDVWKKSLNKAIKVGRRNSITSFGAGHYIPSDKKEFVGLKDLESAKKEFTSGLIEKLDLLEMNNPWKDIYPFYNRWSV